MMSIGIALSLLIVWGLGLGLVGAIWIKKERREKIRSEGQTKFSFLESGEYSPMAGSHSMRR